MKLVEENLSKSSDKKESWMLIEKHVCKIRCETIAPNAHSLTHGFPSPHEKHTNTTIFFFHSPKRYTNIYIYAGIRLDT